MVWYRDIQPLQEPFDVGDVDEQGRSQCAFNVLVTKRPSGSFVQELIAILVAAGVGVANESIFGTSGSAIPSGRGPYLSVRPTGGSSPAGTHNDGVSAYRRPAAQIIVRASSWPAAEGMAQAAYSALVAVRNQAVSA
jgi:hypothetical protein